MRSILVALAASAVLSLAMGCAVEARPAVVDGYTVEGVDTVPYDIYAYPHVAYGGGYAYLVDGRWYYPHEGHWVRFHDEPPALAQYRTHYAGHYGTFAHAHAPAAAHAPPAYGGGPHAESHEHRH